MKENDYDVAIIGGGVIGCCIARELSRYDLRVCLLEKEEDVCSGTSKANSAIVHAGHDAEPGSQKARFNVAGNAMMDALAAELDFDFKRNGTLVFCFSEADRAGLEALYQKGIANGVPGLEIITGAQVRRMEPHASPEVAAALYAPTGGIVCPFGLTIAMAENACDNGVEFRFLTEVKQIEKRPDGYRLDTADGVLNTSCVVNAAGVYADIFHNMVSESKLYITSRRGEYCLMDKEAGSHVSHTIFQLPGKYGKGILVTPTVHGNLLIGPTAKDIDDKEATSTTAEGLDEVIKKAGFSIQDIPYRLIITSFSGLRAHEDSDDFVIGEADDAPGFYNAAGIESPGLSAAPAIGRYLAEEIAKNTGAAEKTDFNPKRKGMIRAAGLSPADRAELIRQNPAYGSIVCRCEEISEGEIVEAIRRTLGTVSLDGIKRRVRQGMGRCQAGFCTPRTMEIIAREQGLAMEAICKNKPGSRMITGML